VRFNSRAHPGAQFGLFLLERDEYIRYRQRESQDIAARRVGGKFVILTEKQLFKDK